MGSRGLGLPGGACCLFLEKTLAMMKSWANGCTCSWSTSMASSLGGTTSMASSSGGATSTASGSPTTWLREAVLSHIPIWPFACREPGAPQGCFWSPHGSLGQIRLMGDGCRSSEIFGHSNFSLCRQEQQLKSLCRNRGFRRIVVFDLCVPQFPHLPYSPN